MAADDLQDASIGSSPVNISTPTNHPSSPPEIDIAFGGCNEPIAIIGMGCRLPGGVSSPADLWDLVMAKRIANSARVPATRFNIDAYYHEDNQRPGSLSVSGGYFLAESCQDFDPTLFGISPVEALWMDPQQRKLLEVVYEAFESSGTPLDQVAGTVTGCYVGNFTSDFQQMVFKEPDFRHQVAITGIDPGLTSNRISHVFNLCGPSVVLNTACSSQMYALHTACTALLNQDCEGAIVAGTNLILSIDQHINTAKLGVLSPTNTSHAFDASADGYGRAEGVGALYIKRLSDALKDGDHVRAVIRSTALNSNGRVPGAGLTSPSARAQADVMAAAYRKANLDPGLTSYVEAHGTGTQIGDPVEARSISLAMRGGGTSLDPILIGSVKPNLGHSEASSSISTIIKAVLAVERGVIPPTAGIVVPNPKIDWDNWKVKLVTEPTPFPSSKLVRRVGVNAFGYGGTNAHCILENADATKTKHGAHKSAQQSSPPANGIDGHHEGDDRPHLLVFSAHDKITLERNLNAYATMSQKTQVDLLDLAYTLATRRSKHRVRAFTVCREQFAISGLQSAFGTAVQADGPATVAFVFTGQGAQWPRMGATLLKLYPSFVRIIQDLDVALATLSDRPMWTLEGCLLEPELESRVNNAEFSQPLCTAIQIGLVALLKSWNVSPIATVGHSSGEIAAAYAAGFLTAEDAIVAAYYRGKSMGEVTANGSMLAISLSAKEASLYLKDYHGRLVVACHNSPSSTTISGDADAIEELKATFDTAGIFARILKTGGKAYHSPHMLQASRTYEDRLKAKMPNELQSSSRVSGCRMISSVTGSLVGKSTIDAAYLTANLISPVLFHEAVRRMITDNPSIDIVVEIGPHAALAAPIRQICAENGRTNVFYTPSLMRNKDDGEQLLRLAGDLWARESPIDLNYVTKIEHLSMEGNIEEVRGMLLVDLPTYQWNYSKKTWTEPRQSRDHRTQSYPRHDVLGRRVPGLSLTESSWQNILRHKDLPWLKHHSLGGEAIFPAAGYFAMAFEALGQVTSEFGQSIPISSVTLRSFAVHAALVVPDDGDGIATLLSMRPSDPASSQACADQAHDFTIYAYSNGSWKTHATGSVGSNTYSKGHEPAPLPTLTRRASGRSWYQRLHDVGFDYGATFQGMNDVCSDGISYEATAKLTIKQKCGIVEGESRYFLHPACLDACTQLIMVAIYAGRLNDMFCGMTSVSAREITVWPPSVQQSKRSEATAHAWTTKRGQRAFLASSQLVSDDGELLVDIVDMQCVAYEAAVPQKSEDRPKQHMYMQMEWKPDIDQLKSLKGMDSSPLPAVEYLADLLLHKNAKLKILDLDASLSPTTFASHEWIDITIVQKPNETSQLVQEDRNQYRNIKFSHIDIEQDLVGQKTDSEYDLVLASKMSNASTSFLQNIHRLLAPGGRLLLLETTASECDWRIALESAGFSGIDLISRDANLGLLHILSTALAAFDKSMVHKTVIRDAVLVYRNAPTAVLSILMQKLLEHSWNIRSSSIEELEHQTGEQVIMLTDFEGPFLATLQETELRSLQRLINSASSILWVTSAGLVSGDEPEYAMTLGFARSLASETQTLKLVTLDFSLGSCSNHKTSSIIFDIANEQSLQGGPGETEYSVEKGVVYINRLVPNRIINEKYAFEQDDAEFVPLKTCPPLQGIMKQGKMSFCKDGRVGKSLDEDWVEIKAMAVGLNKEDNLAIAGSDHLMAFSHEVAGVIVAVGSNVLQFKVGARVTGFCFDVCATHQRTPADLVQPIPVNETYQNMATIPMAFATGLYGLQELARVEAGEIVLILDGGAAALAALQICENAKAESLVIVGHDDDVATLQNIGYPPEKVIRAKKGCLSTEVLHRTSGRGADIVFGSDATDRSVLSECLRILAPFSRVVTFGRRDPNRPVFNAWSAIPGFRRFTFDILDLYTEKPKLLAKLLKESIDLYTNGKISAIKPITVRKISEIEEAIRSYSDKLSDGKLVVSYDPESLIKVMPIRSSLQFRSDATYLLVGCLGGLGRSLTSWMVSRGAKHIALMSRSGADNSSAADTVASIRALGVNVTTLRCDVASKADVEIALKSVDSRYPIRGIVNAAVVIDDGLFHNMTIDRWKTPAKAKLQGSLNLHNIFRHQKLDFFIMTSSISGIIGNSGQTNYAATNTSLDALARHRRARGLPAVSLVLPMVLGVGYVSEHSEIEGLIRGRGLYGINEDELLAAFEISMTPQADLRTTIDHVIVGLDPAELEKSVAQASQTHLPWLENFRFRTAVAMMDAHGIQMYDSTSDSKVAAIETSKSLKDAIAAVTTILVQQLSDLLLVEKSEFLPQSRSVASYGLDSMIGSEFRNWVYREFKFDIPFQQLLAPELTIVEFAAKICAKYRTDF